jgi:P4 family phage/plasmid primase-like protien
MPEMSAATVTLEQLQALAALAPAPPAPAARPRPPQSDQKRALGRLDVAAYLNHYGIEFNTKDAPGRTLYRLSHCLFDHTHRKNEAAVVQDSEGMLTYQCFHDSCKRWTWKDARERISGQDTIARFCEGYQDGRRRSRDSRSESPPPACDDQSPWRFFIKNERGKLVFKETLLVDEIIGKNGYLNVPGVGLYLWTGTVWKRTHEAYLKAKAKDLLGLEASRARVNSVAELIMNDARVLLPHDRELNDIGDALNLLNGVLELGTWKLREPRRDDYCTIQIQANFDPEARCPRWLQFWEEARDGRSVEIIKTAQEFSGYCLTRDNSHQKALIAVGPGQDGKSTWLNTLEALLGEANVSNVAFPDLNDQFIRMQLHNKLLNWAGETEAEKALVSGWFKQIVGGDTIQASYKGQDPVSFKPFCKLIFLMNDYPRVRDVSFGFYRKLLVLPFRKQFLGEDRDKHLFEKLKAELDGILNWALVGLERLRNQREFTVGPESAEALELFQYENNPVRAFLDDCCALNRDAQTPRRTLYLAYTQYSDEGGYRKYSQIEFYKRLRHLVPGFKEVRPRAGDNRPRQIVGVRLLDEFAPKDGQGWQQRTLGG